MAAWVEDVLAEVFATHSEEKDDRTTGDVVERCVALLRREDDSRALLRLLAGAGPDLRDGGAKDRTLLIHAARYGRSSCAGALLEAGASVHCVGADGGTALHSAAYYGHINTCELLLRADAPLSARDRRGETPAEAARAGGHGVLARRIRRAERGEDVAGGQFSPDEAGAAGGGAEAAPELWIKVQLPPRRVTVRRGAGRVFVGGGPHAQPQECFARLEPGLATVGRDASCALRVRDASVSNQHAAIGLATEGDPPAPLGCHYGATMVARGRAQPEPRRSGVADGEGEVSGSPARCGRRWWVADLGSRHGVCVGEEGDAAERAHVWQRLSGPREPSPWHPLPSLPARLRVGAVRLEVLDAPPDAALEAADEDGQQERVAAPRAHTGRKRERPEAVAPPRRVVFRPGHRGCRGAVGVQEATTQEVAPTPPPPSYRDRAAERRARHGAYSSLDAAIRASEERETGKAEVGAAAPVPQSAPQPAPEPRSTRGLGYQDAVSTDLADAAGTALASGNRRSVVWARTALRAATDTRTGTDTAEKDSGAAPTFVSGGWQRPR